MAVASLITGILGCVSLLGLIFGIVALRQIAQRGERGRGLAISGIVLFFAWCVISVVAYAVTPHSGTTDASASATPSPTQTKPKKQDVFKMRIGQCINNASGDSAASGSQAPTEVESVKVVPCNQPHDGEVLAEFKLKGTLRPNDSALEKTAEARCEKLIGPKLDRDPAADRLAITYYFPTEESWTTGDRTVTCLAAPAKDGRKLTRRVR